MPLEPGATVPSAEVRDLDGAPVDLPALSRRAPAVLFVYKGDCPTSALGARALARLANLPGVAVAAISQDDPAEARAFAGAHGWGPAVRVLLDPEPWRASDALGVRTTPTWFLVAPGVRIEMVEEGFARSSANALAARAATLAGAPAVAISLPEDGPAFRPG